MKIHFLLRAIVLIISLLPAKLHSSEVCSDFDTWFKKSKKYFSDLKLQKDEKNIPDLFQEPQNELETLTTAGIRYLMFKFPTEIQQEIAKHIIPSIPSFIIGMHEDEMYSVETIHHSCKPYVDYQNNQQHAVIKCLSCVGKNTINNTSGLYYVSNKTIRDNPQFTTLWNIVRKVSPFKNLKFILFNPDTSCIHTAYQDNDEITWQVPVVTKNHNYYCLTNNNKQALNLYKVLMLLDQTNQYNNPISPLSQTTQKLLINLKKHIEQSTNSTAIIQPTTYVKKTKNRKKLVK